MGWDETKERAIRDAFRVDTDELFAIADGFEAEIRRGLAGERSSLRLLPSFLPLPTGEEGGEYLALDFGGSNVRAARVRLTPPGRFSILSRVIRPLAGGGYDFTGASTAATELFDFLAALVAEAAGDTKTPFRLGHTFSYPSRQTALADACLIQWTKEFAVPGVEERMVNALLTEALSRKGFRRIRPVALVNDTVAILLAGAYERGDTRLGSIYATGHNTCYLEEYGGRRPPMVLNMESGGFDRLKPNAYDLRLDAASEKPGAQRLEKMASGRYLGELFSLALADGIGASVAPAVGADLAACIAGDADAPERLERLLGFLPDGPTLAGAGRIAATIARRSARLVAATFAATLRHRAAGRPIPSQHIAIEGSLYHHVPFIQRELSAALAALLGTPAAGLDVVQVADGSLLGAAIAAAMAKGELR